MSQRKPDRAVQVTLVVISLVVVAVLLGLLMYFLLSAAVVAEEQLSRALVRLAWFILALLALTLLMLFWVVMREVVRATRRPDRRRTPYVNVWAEAGRRFQPPDADDQADDNAPGQDRPAD